MSMVTKTGGKTWAARAILCGLLFALLCLPLHFRSESAAAYVSYSSVAKFTKDFRSNHSKQLVPGLVPALVDRISDLRRSFLRVDRKQNLLLWPVVASELIRSPPWIHSV